MSELNFKLPLFSAGLYAKPPIKLSSHELDKVLAALVFESITPAWEKSQEAAESNRRAYYLSAEFLVGRAVMNNLLNCGLLEEALDAMKTFGINPAVLEEIPDAALGNGGLGRLAACFLESGATLSLPLDGYGIRYRYGLFRQEINDGEQCERPDDWTRLGDPWSVRVDKDSVRVDLGEFSVNAVPYDMPIIGFSGKFVSTLRLWQAEPLFPFDFEKFNNQCYSESVDAATAAENISRCLYPNDNSAEGKLLRLRQEYFFSSASLQDMLRRFEQKWGSIDNFFDNVAIQLNDTHPVIAIPELIRLLLSRGWSFEKAFSHTKKVFCYTNHTVMAEAMEKWDLCLVDKLSSEISEIISRLNSHLKEELAKTEHSTDGLLIVENGTVQMARLASYCAKKINGVAKIHTEILKSSVLAAWHRLYPEKIVNKTNGITPRRWLSLCNPELANLISESLKSDSWKTHLSELEGLKPLSNSKSVLDRFGEIKHQNKVCLAEYLNSHERKSFDPDWIVDVQIKRLHEYKRQLLNILSILELYFEIKEGSIKNFHPTVFIFGAKAAPGYSLAKSIIKLINSVGELIERDEVASRCLKVIFVENYNVTYAEKIIPAADVSVQISCAGTEASGTGNMKLSLNGAVTLGTLDGANIEIVEAAGRENNYIFGADFAEIKSIKNCYNPTKLYAVSPHIRRVLDSLVDGKLFPKDAFRDVFESLLVGDSPDRYFVLHDFEPLVSTRKKLNSDYKNGRDFRKKCWFNMASSGGFSSDRTVMEYAKEIWEIEPVQ